MSSRDRFYSGAVLLIGGGCTASYWYGDLQYLKVIDVMIEGMTA